MSKYPRTPHFFFSKGATNDDRIAHNSENLIGTPIVITEKLDGSNASLTKGGVFARSHGAYSENPWDQQMWNIHARIEKDIPQDTFIFGENMEGIHSIEYSNLRSYFYMFGVRENNIWVTWEKVEEWAYLLDIPMVPILFKGQLNTEKELQELVEELVSQPSEAGGEREGVVVRNAGTFHNDHFYDNVRKWVRADHVQTDNHWTRNWKRATIKYD